MYKHQDVHDIQHQYFRKPQQLTRKEAFKLFLYNPKTSEFFGRTGSSWGKEKEKNVTSILIDFNEKSNIC